MSNRVEGNTCQNQNNFYFYLYSEKLTFWLIESIYPSIYIYIPPAESYTYTENWHVLHTNCGSNIKSLPNAASYLWNLHFNSHLSGDWVYCQYVCVSGRYIKGKDCPGEACVHSLPPSVKFQCGLLHDVKNKIRKFISSLRWPFS